MLQRDLGVLKDMPAIREKACKKLAYQQVALALQIELLNFIIVSYTGQSIRFILYIDLTHFLIHLYLFRNLVGVHYCLPIKRWYFIC
jgi:hypothetical protein